jgi:hypothetical protein
MKFFLLLFIFQLLSCSSLKKKYEPPLPLHKKSEKLFLTFAKGYAPWTPEKVSLPFPIFESQVTSYSRNWEAERYAALYRLSGRFKKLSTEAIHPELKFEAIILSELIDLDILGIQTAQEVGEVPFVPLTEFILENIQYLLRPEASALQKNNALARLRSYIRGGASQRLPLADGLMAFTLSRLESLEAGRKRGLWPLKDDLLRYIQKSPTHLAAIEKILGPYLNPNLTNDLQELRRQDESYRLFLQKKILPYARLNRIIPEKSYSYLLKKNGVTKAPKELKEIGLKLYRKFEPEFRQLLFEVAKEYKLSAYSPEAVFSFLRQGPRAELEATKLRTLGLIKDHNLLNLEKYPPGELTTLPEGAKDLRYKEAGLNLFVRAIYPGKNFFSSMTKALPISGIRSIETHKNYNWEFWARYVEDFFYPYLLPTEKLVFMQNRLLNIARLYLDQDVHLGKIELPQVRDFFKTKLGYSEQFSRGEAERILKNPGLAPTMYAGLLEFQELRDASVSEKVSERCFREAVLAFGILPIFRLKELIGEGLKCDH